MAIFINKTYEFTELVLNTVINTGIETNDTNLGATVKGIGQSAADSNYELHQSNDGEYWELITGAVFNGIQADETIMQKDLVVSMRYIGFVLTSAGAETSGSLTVKLMLK